MTQTHYPYDNEPYHPFYDPNARPTIQPTQDHDHDHDHDNNEPHYPYMFPLNIPTPSTTTLRIFGSGTNTLIRLSPTAYTQLLDTAHSLGYIRDPTAHTAHRYLSVFVNYIALYPHCYPYEDTRPTPYTTNDTALQSISPSLAAPWNLDLPYEEQQETRLSIGPLTRIYFHQLQLYHRIPSRYPHSRVDTVPRTPQHSTPQAILEAIFLGWLTPSFPFPYAPTPLIPRPFKRIRRNQGDIAW